MPVLSSRSRRPLLAWELYTAFFCAWYLALAGLSPAQVASAPSSASASNFTVSGTVVNSVTGEPIARAMVRVFGVVQRSVFTDSEGRFEIDGLPAGSTNFDLQKPGYFSRQQLRSGAANDMVEVGPGTAPVVLKLVPQSAIYGRVTDAAGEPIENVPVRLTEWNVREGRQHLDSRGSAETDEDGRFRFANLTPGKYYLAAGPGAQQGVRLVAHDERPKTGYPSVYYPGVPDLTAASPIQLVAGQQAQADLSMTPAPVYHVSGSLGLAGFLPEQGVGLQILNPSGEHLSMPARFRLDTGTFDIDAVPAGSYVLKAFSQVGNQALRAEIRLNVAGNLDNVHLVLGPALSIPVVVRMESRDPSNLNRPGWSQQRPPVSVRLIPTERLTPELSSTFVQQSPGHEVMALPDVEPGKYAAEVMAWGPWYVQSAQYGPTNLLSEDLTVAPETYPIEIVLRDDGATLTGNFQSSEKSAQSATILIVPQPASRRSPKAVQFSTQNGVMMNGLAPGEYLVFAFDHADKIEYANPEALQPYASQASHVTLSPNQESHVVLNLIHTGEGE